MAHAKVRSIARIRIPWVRGICSSLVLLLGGVSGLVFPYAGGVFPEEITTALFAAGCILGAAELLFLLTLRRLSFAKAGLEASLLLQAAYCIGSGIYVCFFSLPFGALLLSLFAAAGMLLIAFSAAISLLKQ